MRRKCVSVIGSSGPIPAATTELCHELGKLLIDEGFRIVCGGHDGVMTAVCEGGRSSAAYAEGRLVGIMPSYHGRDANPYLDVVINTGIGWSRNTLVVATGDVVIAVAGASGTLNELTMAWQLGKPIIAMRTTGGWAAEMAGRSLDGRRSDVIHPADTAEQAVRLAVGLLAGPNTEFSESTSPNPAP